MSFKILKFNCCGLDVHKTWIYACIGITDSNNRTEYKQARFSSFTKGLNELCDWLAKYNCKDVCMESTGKYWIPVFNILEQHEIWVTLSHPKYTKPMKGNKTDRKDAKWICDLYMCGMVKPSFIPPADIRALRDLVRYRFKLTCMIPARRIVPKIVLLYPILNLMMFFLMYLVSLPVLLRNRFYSTQEKSLMYHHLLMADVKLLLKKYRPLLMVPFQKNKL